METKNVELEFWGRETVTHRRGYVVVTVPITATDEQIKDFAESMIGWDADYSPDDLYFQKTETIEQEYELHSIEPYAEPTTDYKADIVLEFGDDGTLVEVPNKTAV